MVKVSVVIPVYNIEAHLCQCLDSVLGQTLRDIEVICVDDGSTDGSPDILQTYAEKDDRLRVITQANAGPGVARNTGMTQATGEYLIFLDSDDWFECIFLEEMVKKAEQTAADIVICKTVEFDNQTGKELPTEWMLKTRYLPGDTFSPEDVSEYLFQFTYGMPWDKLYRRAFLQESGIEFPDLRNSEDLAFVFPTLLAARQVSVIQKTLIHHRVNRKLSVSNSRTAQPAAPYTAFCIVKDYLEKHQRLEQFEQSFVNWAMEFLVWYVCNMSDRQVQRQYVHVIRTQWFPELQFDKYPTSYFRDKSAYLKYLLVKYLPAWAIFLIVKGYKTVKKLVFS